MDFGISEGLGTLLSGGMQAGGGLLSSIMGNNQSQQNAQNQFVYNTLLQQQQEAYQTQMANTQYQRSVADMKAAGLNPMLAAGGGMSLDAAPSGGSASVGQAQTVSPDFSGVANAAKGGAMLLKELKKIDSDIEAQKARAAQAKGDTVTTPNLANEKRMAEITNLGAGAHKSDQEALESGARRLGQTGGGVGIRNGTPYIDIPQQVAARGAEAVVNWVRKTYGDSSLSQASNVDPQHSAFSIHRSDRSGPRADFPSLPHSIKSEELRKWGPGPQ